MGGVAGGADAARGREGLHHLHALNPNDASGGFVADSRLEGGALNGSQQQGKDLLLTPGVYDVDRSLAVKRADTVVLGLGLATLTAQDGAVPMTVADVRGVDIAGLTLDAGPLSSPALLRVGSGRSEGAPHVGTATDPTALQDVFFRVGGPHVGKATTGLEVNSDETVLDDVWAWRADHGVPGSVGWTVNTADTGVVVNGDAVTATGLFVEHVQKDNVVWNGERGRTVFFQKSSLRRAEPVRLAARRRARLRGVQGRRHGQDP